MTSGPDTNTITLRDAIAKLTPKDGELLPCPFCGGACEVNCRYEYNSSYADYSYAAGQCKSCEARGPEFPYNHLAKSPEIRKAHQDAVTAWNHRTSTALIIALAERLEVANTALDTLSRLGNAPHLGNSDGNMIAQKALAATSLDTPFEE